VGCGFCLGRVGGRRRGWCRGGSYGGCGLLGGGSRGWGGEMKLLLRHGVAWWSPAHEGYLPRKKKGHYDEDSCSY